MSLKTSKKQLVITMLCCVLVIGLAFAPSSRAISPPGPYSSHEDNIPLELPAYARMPLEEPPYYAGLHQDIPSSHRELKYSGPCIMTAKPMNSSESLVNSLHESYLSNYISGSRREYGMPMKSVTSSICITSRDVNDAIEEAKAMLGNYVPKEIYSINSENPKPMQVTVVAEIIAQATRILSSKFKLPETAILYDMPSVDMSKSRSIENICPVFLRPNINCEATSYRTLSGFCNNLNYQSWGATRSAMVRFLAPDYYDSISLPRRAYDGSALPSSRIVSFVMHQDPIEYDKYHSMLFVVWGQFIDHDMTLAVQVLDEEPGLKVDCCKSEDAHPNCFPIDIPKGDPFYSYFNQKCMHFMRASPGLQPGCSLGPVQAMNKISSYIDGNLIYGSTMKVAQRLRAFYGGQLKSQPVHYNHLTSFSHGIPVAGGYTYNISSSHPTTSDAYLLAAAAAAETSNDGLDTPLDLNARGTSNAPSVLSAAAAASAYKELLPANRHSPDQGCERKGRASDAFCFDAGDHRANEQVQLTAMHTIMLREHNRIARQLSYINPHWKDEVLFQETRKIVVAQLQHITFNEFLSLVIGKDKVYQYGLELEAPGKYFTGYDSKINAGIRVEFQAAAFRYGHSILPSNIERYNKYHQRLESIRLSKLLKQPFDLYHAGTLDSYILGLTNQRAGRMDPTLSTEVTNHLFEKPGKLFGIDLAAINIQRGREMGVPGYNHFRDYCGLPRAKYFNDLSGVFSNKTLLRLAQLYKSVDDIDLWTAGISEYPVHDGLVGPTFACLIARQFVNLRRGDRFWYENIGHPESQFTIEQLDEIRKSTAALLICENSDDVETIQASAMLIPDPYTNPRVHCDSLPRIDFNKWREYRTSPVNAPVAYQRNNDATYKTYEAAAAAASFKPAQDSPVLPSNLPATSELYDSDAIIGENIDTSHPLLDYDSPSLFRQPSSQEPIIVSSSKTHSVEHIINPAQYKVKSMGYHDSKRKIVSK